MLKAELQKLVPLTRAEEGCVRSDLHQEVEHLGHFWLYEIWASEEDALAHRDRSHTLAFVAATEGAIADFRLHEIVHIGG